MQLGMQHSFASLFYDIVFYRVPYTSTAEAESLAPQIVTALHKIKNILILNFKFDRKSNSNSCTI